MRRNVLTSLNITLSFEFDDAYERDFVQSHYDDVIELFDTFERENDNDTITRMREQMAMQCARDTITSLINERLRNTRNIIVDEITFGDWELQ